MRGTLKSLSIVHEKNKAKLDDLKIQMYQKDIVKDAEAESVVLQKRLKEMEESSSKWERTLRKILMARLKEEVEGLKLFLVMAGVSNPKFDPK